MKTILIIISGLAFLNCSRSTNSDVAVISSDSVRDIATLPDTTSIQKTLFSLGNYISHPISDSSKIQVIDFNCAIFVHPGEEQIDAMEKEYGENDLATIADDNSFYDSEATAKLDSSGIKIITSDKPFLMLKGSSANWTLNLRKKDASPWLLIFFNKEKEPQILFSIDVNRDQIDSYFKN